VEENPVTSSTILERPESAGNASDLGVAVADSQNMTDEARSRGQEPSAKAVKRGPGPIQGGTISTSNAVCSRYAQAATPPPPSPPRTSAQVKYLPFEGKGVPKRDDLSYSLLAGQRVTST